MKEKAFTDSQLVQIAIKLQNVFNRARQGAYADPHQVLESVESVVQGEVPTPPFLATSNNFLKKKWRDFSIDGITVETIILMPKDFKDFSGKGELPLAEELFDPVYLTAWSRENARRLPRGYAIGLFPRGAERYIHNQYMDRPIEEVLFIATEECSVFDENINGYPVHYVSLSSGKQQLAKARAAPGISSSPYLKTIFPLIPV